MPVCQCDSDSLPLVCCGQAEEFRHCVKEERRYARTTVVIVESVEKEVEPMVERVLIVKLGSEQNDQTLERMGTVLCWGTE